MRNHPTTSRKVTDLCGGIFLGMLLSYCFYSLPDWYQGQFHLDLALLRNLAVLGMLVILFGVFRERLTLR